MKELLKHWGLSNQSAAAKKSYRPAAVHTLKDEDLCAGETPALRFLVAETSALRGILPGKGSAGFQPASISQRPGSRV